MTVTAALESLAKDTWERLRDSEHLQIRFGEETITDLVLLELKRMKEPGIQIIQTDKHKEKISGTDWEWWIGSPRVGWLRFAIQAKRLKLSSRRYDHLNHKVAGVRQVDLLEKYASLNKAIPVYCLFNFDRAPHTKNAWKCCQGFDEPQLACTITPSATVRRALAGRGRRTFRWMHQSPQSLPWRCLAKCPRVLALYNKALNEPTRKQMAKEVLGRSVVVHEHVPSYVQAARESGFVALGRDEQSVEARRMQPRQIAVLELTPDEEKHARG